MGNLALIEGIEQIQDGYIIPATLPLGDVSDLVVLIRHQMKILDGSEDNPIFDPIPSDDFSSDVLWARNDLSMGDLSSCGELEPDIMSRPIDRYTGELWKRLYKADLVQTAVAPIFIKPWYHEGDTRRRHLSKIYLEFLAVGSMAVAMGGAARNMVELKKGFEVASIRAAIASAVRTSRCLDLRGVRLAFKDKEDEHFHRVMGQGRRRVFDVDRAEADDQPELSKITG